MLALPRLRQVALVASDRARVEEALESAFGLTRPFHDPGVAEFGLDNSVYAIGESFLEVVSPVRPATTAGRFLERRGGDSGYMAIFQVADVSAARQRVSAAGIRTVWQTDLPDMAGTHLHPKDVPGAIVSIDWADPPDAWRWAGPEWTGQSVRRRAGSGGIAGLTVEVNDPISAAERWATTLGLAAQPSEAEASIDLPAAGQVVTFVPVPEGGAAAATAHRAEGISEVRLRLPGFEGKAGKEVHIGGIRFMVQP